MPLRPILAAGFLLAAASAHAQGAAPPPAAPPVATVRPATDTYFGQTVSDPYRWMENETDPAFKMWLKGQADYAAATLAAVPGRDALLARIKALDTSGGKIGSVEVQPGFVFYKKTRPTDDTSKLYVRRGLRGPERILLDPDKLAPAGQRVNIDEFAPSRDGRYVEASISPGGSELGAVRVVNVVTGKLLPDTIDRVRGAGVVWRPDGRSFYYNRLQKLPAGGIEIDYEQKNRVFLHTLGTDASKDVPVFGYGLSPRTAITKDDFSYMQSSPASPYAVGLVIHGTQNELTLYAAPLASITGPAAPWVKVCDVPDAVTSLDMRGDTIYLLTHRGASRFKVVKTSLSHPDIARATTVVPASNVVIQGVTVAQDALYVTDLDGGVGRLRRVPFAGGPAQAVPIPFAPIGLVIAADPRLPGVLMQAENATHAPLWYAYNPRTARLADTGLQPPSPVDFSAYTTEEAKAPGKDGTLVPVTIVHKRGLVLDGSHPTILDGYGSYGINEEAFFFPSLLAFLERGGVYAVAHVRGGGEYGEDWHLAGQKLKKHNTWEDFNACGQYLVNRKYTSPAHLGGIGGSAGGILIGRAMEARPDLWAAVVDGVPMANMVRVEASPNGPPQVPEFGTVSTKGGFQSLYAMDSTLHVADGTHYPAVLVTTGINDPRVAPWMPAKMAARLQAAAANVAGAKPVLLRVDYKGGHQFNRVPRSQQDAEFADIFAFFLWQMGDPDFRPKD